MGMHEASDYDSVDSVSPFIGAIVKNFCSQFESAVATKSFIDNVDVVDCM